MRSAARRTRGALRTASSARCYAPAWSSFLVPLRNPVIRKNRAAIAASAYHWKSLPGHSYGPQDKPNFTALVQILRGKMGDRYELSFAAGGFDYYLQEAVDWAAIMPLLDNVNLMSYDIVNGNTPHTGHHTALYSTPEQKDSTDNAVQFLLKKGVAPQKIIVGAAFYARTWKDVANTNNGLYQSGTHIDGIHFREYSTHFTSANGYELFWDDVAKAPFAYNATEKTFATFDDKKSIAAKMAYIKQQKLGGIMFWQLPHDASQDGLLNTIDQARRTPTDTEITEQNL